MSNAIPTLPSERYKDHPFLELKPGAQFCFFYLNGPLKPDRAHNEPGVYKCGICGEIGTFIGNPTHFQIAYDDDSWRSVDWELETGVSRGFPEYRVWCAGRPDLTKG